MSSVTSLNSLLSSGSASSSSSSVDLSSLLAAATGASSVGIDVTSAVDAAIYAARAPEREWQSQQTTIQSQVSALTAIQTSLGSVSADLDSLNDPGGALTAKTVTSSDASTVSAIASSAAVAGSHVISVTNLATSASWYSTPLSSANASVGSSVLTIALSSGTQRSFALGAAGLTSLGDLAASINAAGLGLDASVISDSVGSRLSLVSHGTGSAANFTVSDGASEGPTWNSASLASGATGLTSSSLQISDGATTANISVSAGESLDTLATQINALGLNLAANVVKDSDGAHLSLVSSNGSNVTVSSDPALSLTQSNVGKNAQLSVDGVPVVSSSNTISGAIPGITLNLGGIPASNQVTLQVASNTSQITSTLSQFVKDYNSALSLVNAQFTYSASTSSQGALGSDAALRSLQSALLGLTAYTTASASGSSAPYSLASLGISVNNDGSLSLDATRLNQALTSNPDAVQNFFLGAGLNGFAATAQTQLKTFTSPGSGVLAADVNDLQQEYSDLQTHINDFESGYIASQQTILTTMYSKAETALQQLPATLKQIQAQLGGGNSGS